MKISIVTNPYPDGWSPDDYHKGMLGGSEEAIILFSEELAKRGFEVVVYHPKKEGSKDNEVFNGVAYRNDKHFVYNYQSTLISFKSLSRLTGISSKKNLVFHWSCEVEKFTILDHVDYFVHISNFHKTRHFFLHKHKAKVIPLGIDKALLDQNKVEKEPNVALYCSSPDRGLANLLDNWKTIKKKHPHLKLRIAYGFNHIEAIAHRDPNINRFIDKLFQLMEQPDIEYLGALSKEDIAKEYWRASFWMLPLQHPESELFCLNAIKSNYCGCIPIVNKIGALKETVGKYIDYNEFVQGDVRFSDIEATPTHALTWAEVIDTYWMPLLTQEKDETL